MAPAGPRVVSLFGVGASGASVAASVAASGAARALQPEARMDTPPDAPAPAASSATPPSPPLVIYHADCTDGFAAAWAAHHRFPADTYVELHPAVYRQPPPDVTGREVYVVDFSYDRATLCDMHARAKSLVVVDHHKTAAKEPEGLDFCVFDMNRSGAGLAWDVLAAPTRGPRPRLIDYVEDRDLWRWQLHGSREVNAYLGSLPHTLVAFTEAAEVLGSPAGFALARAAGLAVLAAQERYVDWTVACARWRSLRVPGDTRGAVPVLGLVIDEAQAYDVDVPVVNCGPFSVSEVLERLKRMHPDAPFVAAWYERADGRLYYSLRSDEAGADVGRIAREIYRGGGHRHAAGFDVAAGLRADVRAKGEHP